jgi:1,2-diacylglycerol 3-beta-galactosyltransferase
MQRPTAVLILTADYGSGHRSAAQALATACTRYYQDEARVVVYNPLHHHSAPALLRRAEKLYLEEVQHAPTLYRLHYALTDLPITSLLADSSARQFLRSTMREVLSDHPADVIVSVFPFYSAAATAAYHDAPTRPGFISVVTDLGAVHRTWFTASDDYCAVPTEHAWDKALRSGMDPQRLRTTGIPVHPDFGTPRADQPTLRRDQRLHEDVFTVLLLGGGAGIGQLDMFADALAAAGLPIQLMIVAGRNAALAAQLRTRTWAIPVRVYEFVPLADLMHAADVVATKAGGLTISEALAAGKPLLIHGTIPGQEEGNLRYILEQGAGLWAPDPPTLTDQIRRWLEQPDELRRFIEAARRIGRPDAARSVVQLVLQLAEGGPLAHAPQFLAPIGQKLQARSGAARQTNKADLADLRAIAQALQQRVANLRRQLEATADEQEVLEAHMQQLGPRSGTSWRRWLGQQRWLNQRQQRQIASLEHKLEQWLAKAEQGPAPRARGALERIAREIEPLD